MAFEQFALVARALGSAHRLELLDILVQGERSVERLALAAGLTINNTSQHLQQLRRAGLVVSRKTGTQSFSMIQAASDGNAVVDGTPQIHLLARDPDDHFVEMPAIARSRTARSQAPRDRRSEFEPPTANALVGDVEPAFGKQLFDIAIA